MQCRAVCISIIRPHNFWKPLHCCSQRNKMCCVNKKIAVRRKDKDGSLIEFVIEGPFKTNELPKKTSHSTVKLTLQTENSTRNSPFCKFPDSMIWKGYLFFGLIKQLLDAAMTDINFIQSRHVISNSGKSLLSIACLDWINLYICHRLVQ